MNTQINLNAECNVTEFSRPGKGHKINVNYYYPYSLSNGQIIHFIYSKRIICEDEKKTKISINISD